MDFLRILVFAIIAYVFAVLFNFIIITAVLYVPEIKYPVPVYHTTGQVGAPLLPTANTTLKRLVSVNLYVLAKNAETGFRRIIAPQPRRYF